MGSKPVTELSGIGPILGGRLSAQGYDRANVVLGQYLLLRKNKNPFKEWLSGISGANNRQQEECYRCINDWCKYHMAGDADEGVRVKVEEKRTGYGS